MPTSSVDSSMIEYYNGRAVDVQGNPIGTSTTTGDFRLSASTRPTRRDSKVGLPTSIGTASFCQTSAVG